MVFQVGNVHESVSLFNLKEKKNCYEDGKTWSHNLENLVYYANH